jgi:hypothetical protein
VYKNHASEKLYVILNISNNGRKKGMKFGANQILHATMKLYQFTEDGK